MHHLLSQKPKYNIWRPGACKVHLQRWQIWCLDIEHAQCISHYIYHPLLPNRNSIESIAPILCQMQGVASVAAVCKGLTGGMATFSASGSPLQLVSNPAVKAMQLIGWVVSCTVLLVVS